MGLGLVKFVGGGQESPLIKRIGGIRRQLASELGFLLGPVRVIDNIGAEGARVRDLAQRRGDRPLRAAGGLRAGHPGGQSPNRRRAARQTKEPAFGMTGWWVPAEQAERAPARGFTVVDPVSVLGTHLAELVRRYAHELFSRQDAKKFLDRVAAEHPKVVEDLVPKLLPLATVQRVLQNLLRERVSIRDSVTILEALGEAAVTTRNPVLLTEYVRQALRRMVVKPYLNAQRRPARLSAGPCAGANRGIQPSSTANRTAILTLGPAGHSRPAAANQPEGRQPGNAGGGDRQFRLALLPPPDGGTYHAQPVLHFA